MVYIPQSASMVPRFQQSHDWSTANLSVLQQSDYRSKLHVQLQDADVCNADGIADLTAWKQLEQNVVHCMICQNKYQRYDFRTLQRHTTNKTYGNKTETVTLSKQTQISYYSYYLLLLTNSSTKITSTILELFLSLFSAMKFHDFCRAAAYCPPDCATSLSQASGHGERMNQILQCSGYGLISMMLVDTCLMFFCHSMNIYGHHQYIYIYIYVYPNLPKPILTIVSWWKTIRVLVEIVFVDSRSFTPSPSTRTCYRLIPCFFSFISRISDHHCNLMPSLDITSFVCLLSSVNLNQDRLDWTNWANMSKKIMALCLTKPAIDSQMPLPKFRF